MAAPSFVQASTGGTDAMGAWSATGTAGTSGNVVILQILQDGSTAGAVTLDSATNIEDLAGTDNQWTFIGTFPGGSGTTHYQHIWIGRLINTSAPTATGSNSTSEDLYWRFYEFTNVNTGTTLASVIENATIASTYGYGTGADIRVYGGSGTQEMVGQSFTTMDATRLKSVALRFLKVGFPSDNLVIELQSDSSNLPSGTVLTTIATVAAASVTDSYVFYTYSLDYALSASTKYWIVCRRSGARDTSNCISLSGTNLSAYAGGGRSVSNSGTWEAESSTIDLSFYVLADSGLLLNRALTTTASIAASAVTTLGPDRLALNFIGINDDNALADFTGETGGDWTEAVAEYAESSGTDATIGLQIAYQSWTNNNTASGTLEGITFGNGYWVVVGRNGALFYQNNMTLTGAWTSNTHGSEHLWDVAYGNGYWVAVGNSGTIYYTTDPTGSWTSNTQGTNALWSVTYANGYWVAVGENGALWYKASTPDGTWTSNTQGSAVPYFYDVAYGNGYWVAVGWNGVSGHALYYKASTPDGAWTSNAQGTTIHYGVIYANGYWVTVGDTGELYYKASTPDGAWTSNTQGASTHEDITFDGIYWYVLDGANGYRQNGTPAGTWVSDNNGASLAQAVHFANGHTAVAGSSGAIRYRASYTPTATTINGGTTTNVDPTDGWGVVGFALKGTTPDPSYSPPPTAIAYKAKKIVTLI